MAIILPNGKQAYTTNAGIPLVNGKVYTYAAGTSTPQQTFSDAAGTVPNTNPVILDSRGEATIFWTGTYKVTLKDALDGLIWSVDNIRAVDAVSSAGLAASSGASLVGFIQLGTGAQAYTVEEKLREVLSVPGYGPVGAANDATTINTSLLQQDTSVVGSFEMTVPDRKYNISAATTKILGIQNGTSLVGSSLEGTQFFVTAGSTSTSLLKDLGSAAKTEVYNITLNGNGNANLLALLDLGTDGSVAFGTYGRIDNLMGRDAPNATAFNLSTNIVAIGDLYSINTRDGLVTLDGGSGAMARLMTPYGFSRYGIKFGGIGDSVIQTEAEAPTSDNAIPWFASRDGSFGVGTQLAAIQSGRVVKTMFAYNPTYVTGVMVGPWRFIRGDATARFGDSTGISGNGVATAVGTNTITDTAQNWKRNQFRGGAIFITTGTGTGTWARIAGNSKDTITIASGAWISIGVAPIVGSGFAVDYACKQTDADGNANGLGHMTAQNGMTMPEAAILSLAAQDTETDTLQIGRSSIAPRIGDTFYAAQSLTFGLVGAGAAVTQFMACPGVDVARKQVVIGDIPPSAFTPGIIYYFMRRAVVGQLVVVAQNVTAGGITPPAAQNFGAMVLDLGV